MATIQASLNAVLERIALACKQSDRSPGSVKLLAVSKTHPADSVKEAMDAGQKDFGENYLQEAIEKIDKLKTYRSNITWHLIGPLQSNKTKLAAEYFDWVQSVDRLKIAQRLSDQRPDHLPPLNICVQVNISGEASKSGINPEELSAFCIEIAKLKQLNLRGLMAIPEPGSNNLSHQAMGQLFKETQLALANAGLAKNFDTLSLGMSDDLETAIASGSTMVRIGTAIFGARPTKQA